MSSLSQTSSLYILIGCGQGGTILGQPHRVEELGDTEIPEEVFNQYLIGLKDSFRYIKYRICYSQLLWLVDCCR